MLPLENPAEDDHPQNHPKKSAQVEQRAIKVLGLGNLVHGRPFIELGTEDPAPIIGQKG